MTTARKDWAWIPGYIPVLSVDASFPVRERSPHLLSSLCLILLLRPFPLCSLSLDWRRFLLTLLREGFVRRMSTTASLSPFHCRRCFLPLLALEPRSWIRSFHPSMALLLSATRSQPLCFLGCRGDGLFPSSFRCTPSLFLLKPSFLPCC
ncbi:hypothetical protein BHE74_00018478 [Ensete ventricosum]|nr:hypothetical protein BHE74_00018478 [Ensete ventricosum]